MTVNLEFTYCNSNDFAQETAQSRSLKKYYYLVISLSLLL